jgi:hypothetical protein
MPLTKRRQEDVGFGARHAWAAVFHGLRQVGVGAFTSSPGAWPPSWLLLDQVDAYGRRRL